MGYRIEEMHICLQCADLQGQKLHSLFLEICKRYCSNGKCIFRSQSSSSPYSLMSQEYEIGIFELEASRFLITTETDSEDLIYLKPAGHSMTLEPSGTSTHTICAFPALHDESE